MAPQQYDVVVTTNQFGDIPHRYRAGIGPETGPRAGAMRRGKTSDGAGDHAGARHRRAQARKPLRYDHRPARMCSPGSPQRKPRRDAARGARRKESRRPWRGRIVEENT